jgi:ACS family glucarate transporter-like MFS transporter
MASNNLEYPGAITAIGKAERPGRSAFRWVILLLISIIYMLVAVDRANLGIALPSIKNEFHISNAQAGLFATVMFVAFAIAQIPASLLTRKVGPRAVMTVALVLTALASYLIGDSASTFDIKLYRSLLGVAEASVSVCCITALNNWFSVRERGTATGYYWGASKMGPVICPPISTLILQAWGWRAIFQTFAIPVLTAALFWLFLGRNKPEQSRFVSEVELERITSVEPKMDEPRDRRAAAVPAWVDRLIRYRQVEQIDDAAGVFRSWDIMGVTIAGIFIVGIFNVFLAWIPSYLLEAKHLSVGAVGIVTATPFAGAVTGNFAGGWISDNLLQMRRKPLMMCGALCTALAIVALIFSPASAVFTGLLLLVAGFVVGLGYPHFSVYPMSFTTRDIYPIAYGVTNTGAAIGAALFPLIAGMILDATSWSVLFAFLVGSSLLGLVILATIIEPAVSHK